MQLIPVHFARARSMLVDGDHISFAGDNGIAETWPNKARSFVVRCFVSEFDNGLAYESTSLHYVLLRNVRTRLLTQGSSLGEALQRPRMFRWPVFAKTGPLIDPVPPKSRCDLYSA